MRRMLAVATTAACLFAASLPGAVAAARPDRLSDTQTDLYCEGSANDAGSIVLYASVSETFGSFADLAFWAAPAVPFEDPPTLIALFGEAMLGSNGQTMSATFQLVPLDDLGADPDPATMSASLTPDGEAEAFSFDDRDGNRRFSVTYESQPLAVAGSLELPGDLAFDLSACHSSTTTFDEWSTNPDAMVGGYEDRSISCSWEGPDHSIGLSVNGHQDGAYSEVYVSDASGSAYGFTETPTFTDSELSASYELFTYDPITDSPQLFGTAVASADVTVGETTKTIERRDGAFIRVTGEQLLLSGTLAVETAAGSYELAMDGASCHGQDVEVRHIFTTPNRGGPRVANDTPDRAVELVPGDVVSLATAGTAAEAEAPCVISNEEGEWEVPLGHTVWYSVAGTGGDVTIDTAGSDFDTVIGVYVGSGETFEQVACVDDVVDGEFGSLQAAVTFATEVGVTYWVQAGGFAEQSGTLQLSVE